MYFVHVQNRTILGYSYINTHDSSSFSRNVSKKELILVYHNFKLLIPEDTTQHTQMHTLPELLFQVGLSLSGFPHNGVTVFGGLTPMPIILSEAVLSLRPSFVWMGAGHPLLKLGVSSTDLVSKLGAIVADISIPRDGSAPAGGEDSGAFDD